MNLHLTDVSGCLKKLGGRAFPPLLVDVERVQILFSLPVDVTGVALGVDVANIVPRGKFFP